MQYTFIKNRYIQFLFIYILSCNVWAAHAAWATTTDISMSFERGPWPGDPTIADPIIPSGAGDRVPAPECQAHTLEMELAQNRGNPEYLKNILNRFFEKCEVRTARFGMHFLLALAQLAKVQYKFLENPHIREVKFSIKETYADGSQNTEVIRGLVALQPDPKPRPLLLIKCGLFCSISDSTMFRNLLMYGFDESPFNLVVLNGNVSPEYYIDNHRVSLGGFDEGRQVFQLAEWLRTQSSLAPLISSLHLIGISMGGQGALFASAYNSHVQMANGRRPLDSVASLCPVVDLRSSMNFVFNQSLARTVFYGYFRDLILAVYDQVPVLGRLFSRNSPPPISQIQDVVANAALDYYSKLADDWSLDPFGRTNIRSPDDLWNANNFSPMMSYIETPTLIWGTRNDGIVNFPDNTQKLIDDLRARPNPNVNLLDTLHGNHCGYSLAYGWDTISSILRVHVLSHSPEFLAQQQIHVENATIPPVTFGSGERHISQEWIAKAGDSNLTLRYKLWNKYGHPASNDVNCWVNPFEAPEQCYHTTSVQVPLSALPIPNLRVPTTETMAQSLTRWLNANVEILDRMKAPLTNSVSQAMYVRWKTY